MANPNIRTPAAAQDKLSLLQLHPVPTAAGASEDIAVSIRYPGTFTEAGGAQDRISVGKYTQPYIPVQKGPVLNPNTDFDGGSLSTWVGFNGTATTSSSPPAGSPTTWAAHYVNNGISAGALEQSGTGGPFTVLPNIAYVITAWVYSSSGNVVIGFDWQNGSHGFLSTSTNSFTIPPNWWTQVAISFSPSQVAPTAVFGYARVGSSVLSTDMWIAHVVVTAASPLTGQVIARPVFIKSRMPVMHVQNLVTGQWLHRDVQGVTSPSVTWNMNTADSFSCTLAPPRPDMQTSSGEPLLAEWRDACYLEEDDIIRWGGILTSSTFDGPQWRMGFTGFAGFANGIPYEGPDYVRTKIEAMQVVRDIWNWIQSSHGYASNIGLSIDAKNTGFLLGNQLPTVPLSDKLNQKSNQGDSFLFIAHPDPWTAGMVLRVGNEGTTYKIKSISGHKFTLTAPLKGSSSRYAVNAVVTQVVDPTPFTLYWYNSTDLGQEIESIRSEAIFDWRETHAWNDSTKAAVRHTWVIGTPRLGGRRTDLRFCEGENIVTAGTVTRDGSKYADKVIGLGAGQGSGTIRSIVTNNTGRLNRTIVYQDQTIRTTARMTSVARRVQQSMNNIDEVTSITVKNHPNAPFGSFAPGDDVLVQLATGWRKAAIWSRVTGMTQDPQTDLMTISLARSDSFTYMAQSGQDGTL